MTTEITSHQKYFNAFMGRWEGLSKTFDENGALLESTAVHMDIAWLDSETFEQVEHIERLYQVGEVTLKSRIRVSEKIARAKTDHLDLQATALSAGVFFFRVESGVSKTTLHNTHVFLDHNTRRVVTHKIKDGKTFVFQVQDFNRID
ncbi:hypothetical protein [Caldimonas brevitalea]|uniref:Uncharacterized protein n=1 Tax=Caldimonas brevitalea TaxID=413882 RepID=A0A0G3BWD3_9BURK|nr:hypothetical protein [Caldimonas brevitalea]AKJ30815.1 hypothetical protein AAW51_4124 [Caldimonas brevitalea]